MDAAADVLSLAAHGYTPRPAGVFTVHTDVERVPLHSTYRYRGVNSCVICWCASQYTFFQLHDLHPLKVVLLPTLLV